MFSVFVTINIKPGCARSVHSGLPSMHLPSLTADQRTPWRDSLEESVCPAICSEFACS